MLDDLILRVRLNGLLFAILTLGCMANLTQGVTLGSAPQASLSPTPESTVIALIDSIVVNGVKADTASSSDIELSRAGAVSPEPTVNVGTKLMAGDKIKTRDQDQVVLRVPNTQAGNDDLVYLDPNSEVAIGSICAVAGRILSWAGVGFRLCTSSGTLGVEGTQFEVNIGPTPDVLTVVVFEGEVKLEPQSKLQLDRKKEIRPKAVTSQIEVQETKTISPDKALKIKSDGTAERVDTSLELRIQGIDYWSEQMIKVNKTVGVVKGFVNHSEEKRADDFKKARREALINDSPTAYLAMAQALNDWDEGAAAKKSLSKVKDTTVRDSIAFMVNNAEADRLQGNLAQASIQLDKAILKYPDDARAYYLKAKVSEEIILRNPEVSVAYKAEVRKNLTKALFYDSAKGKSQINTSLAAAELEQAIHTNGSASLVEQPWLSPGYEWFDVDGTHALVKYAGIASVNVGGRSASGEAELSVIGDQFKLIVAGQLFTGRIVGNPYGGGASFAMQFDQVRAVGPTRRDVTLSVRGIKSGRGLVLQSAPAQSGSLVFSSSGIRPR
jgi:hypothetical protein